MLQHLEQWGLSLWLHQTIMVPLGWRNSPLWSPQWRAPETSFCSSPCSFPFTPSALLPLTPSGERLKTVGWRLLFWEGQGARGRVKNNILYSRAWTAPPAHQTSNKYGYRLIKNKEREEKKNEGATFLWQRFTASLITGSSLSSPTSIHSAHCSLYQLYLRIPSVGTERCRMSGGGGDTGTGLTTVTGALAVTITISESKTIEQLSLGFRESKHCEITVIQVISKVWFGDQLSTSTNSIWPIIFEKILWTIDAKLFLLILPEFLFQLFSGFTFTFLH